MIRFPEPVKAALRDGRLVVFAGAGVSMEEAQIPDNSKERALGPVVPLAKQDRRARNSGPWKSRRPHGPSLRSLRKTVIVKWISASLRE